MGIKNLTIATLITLTLNSYASKCNDIFNNEDPFLSQTRFLELNSIGIGQSILKTMKAFFEHLAKNIQDSKGEDTTQVKLIKIQQLQEIENLIRFSDQAMEQLNNASTIVKETLSQSNDPENDFSLLIPLTSINHILVNQVEPFRQLLIQQEYQPNATHISKKDIELLQNIQRDLENKGVELHIQIRKIEDKITHLQTKNNFSQSHNLIQIKESTDKHNENNELKQKMLDTMRGTANDLTTQFTSTQIDSINFDTFTRDSILLLLLQHTNDGFKEYLEKVKILSEETNKMIILINNTQKNTSLQLGTDTQNNLFGLTSSNHDKLKRIKLKFGSAITFFENSIQITDKELKKSINKGKKRDKRVDNTTIKTIFDLKFLQAITEVLNDMAQIEVNNALIEATAFVENNP